MFLLFFWLGDTGGRGWGLTCLPRLIPFPLAIIRHVYSGNDHKSRDFITI